MLAGPLGPPQQLLSKGLFYVAAVRFPRAARTPLLITAAINQFSSFCLTLPVHTHTHTFSVSPSATHSPQELSFHLYVHKCVRLTSGQHFFGKISLMLTKAAFNWPKYSKIRNNSVIYYYLKCFLFEYILKCDLFLCGQSEFFNHSNMLISYNWYVAIFITTFIYDNFMKSVVLLNILVKTVMHFFSKFKRRAFIWNRNLKRLYCILIYVRLPLVE